ncbi:MAG: hypothetical protein ACRDSE_18925 [Pseudonocardiaceae bacterium]
MILGAGLDVLHVDLTHSCVDLTHSCVDELSEERVQQVGVAREAGSQWPDERERGHAGGLQFGQGAQSTGGKQSTHL